MGTTSSVHCENCGQYWGSLAVLNISDIGIQDGYNFCIDCYKNVDRSTLVPKRKTPSRKCMICSCRSKSTNNCKSNKFIPFSPVFKIYWYGKLGNMCICENCLYTQKYKK